MYFYITEYGQYVHSGSDPQIHNWLASGESILLLPSSALDISLSLSPPLDWLQFL